MTRTWSIVLPALALAGYLSGCALLSKKPARAPRYFTPTPDAEPKAGGPVPAHTALRLRLGRVTSISTLRQPIAYRPSEREVRFYDERRWTARPEAYLQRALERSLFENHGLTRVVSGNAPTLQVELTAFEELLGPPHRVRAEAVVVLYEEGVACLNETVRIEEPVPAATKAGAADAAVQALSVALQELVERVSQRSVAALIALESEV